MSRDFWVNRHRFSFAVFESGTVCLLNLITSKSANAHASRYNGGDLRNALAHDIGAMRTKIQLIRGQDSMTVEADLVELVQKHVNDYASEWKEQLRLYGQEDKFWDWEFKLQFVIHRQPNREGYAIEYESKTQGLMLIETQMHGSRISEGKRLVYIDGIASAPWNREFIQRPPKLKGVGTALLAFARNRSIELGYEGRVGLHSLPGVEEFYDNQGMIDLGEDEDYEDLVYFEYGVRRSSE